MDERQELARFNRASERIVRHARKDKTVADKFLRDAGYFTVMRGVSKAGKTSSTSAPSVTKSGHLAFKKAANNPK